MTTLKHRLAIAVALGTLILVLGTTAFGQGSKRTLIEDSANDGTKTETTEASPKKDSSTSGATATEAPSKPQTIAGSGLSQPSTQTAKSAWPQQTPTGSYELFYKPIG